MAKETRIRPELEGIVKRVCGGRNVEETGLAVSRGQERSLRRRVEAKGLRGRARGRGVHGLLKKKKILVGVETEPAEESEILLALQHLEIRRVSIPSRRFLKSSAPFLLNPAISEGKETLKSLF